MKRCALSLLLACLSLAALLAVGCGTDLRQQARGTNSLTGVIEAELWSDHKYLELGKPIRVRVTLKNVSREIQMLGGKGENENKPVVDILMQSSMTEGRWWSQEHPNDVKYLITLKPGEAYVVEWIVTPTLKATYNVNAWWADSEGDRSGMGVTIFYGIRPPGPMP